MKVQKKVVKIPGANKEVSAISEFNKALKESYDKKYLGGAKALNEQQRREVDNSINTLFK